MNESVRLLQALNSKICHDLAGSIGTIDNCLELTGNASSKIGDQAKQLMFIESKKLVNNIKFFRKVYGIACDEKDITLLEVCDYMSSFFADSNVTLSHNINPSSANVSSPIAKVISCLLSIVFDYVIAEGEIELKKADDNDEIKIIGKGRLCGIKQENFAILNGQAKAEITVRNCREHYVVKLCTISGYSLVATQSKDQIEYLIKKV